MISVAHICEMVQKQDIEKLFNINREAFTEYSSALYQYINNANDKLLRKFVKNIKFVNEVRDALQKEMPPSPLKCYRLYQFIPGVRIGQNDTISQELLEKPVGSSFQFTPGKEFPFQHWTTDKAFVEDTLPRIISSAKTTMRKVSPNNPLLKKENVTLESFIPLDCILFATDFVADDVIDALQLMHKNEHEVVVWHDRMIGVKVIGNTYKK